MKLTMKRGFEIVKFLVKVPCCYPPTLNASNCELIIWEIRWMFSLSLILHAQAEMFQSILRYTDDIVKVTKLITEMLTIGLFKMMICRYHRKRLQTAHIDCDDFLDHMTPRESEAMQRCVDKISTIYVTYGICVVSSTFVFCMGPLFPFVDQPFPSDIEYLIPGLFDSATLYTSIYVIECLTVLFGSFAAYMDIELALLLWYFGVRFEVLCEKFSEATTSEEFNQCIVEHQQLLEAVDVVIQPTRHAALSVAFITILGNIFCAYQFVTPTDMQTKGRFFVLFCAMAMEVLVYTWPADYLSKASGGIGSAAFYSSWIDDSGKRRKIPGVILRAQKPVIIQIDGLLPELSLEFYGRFLTTSFSYFTTLRAVTSD